MVELVAKRGYAATSVQLVVARAGVSRRTFYRCFESRQACFLAIMDIGLERAEDLVVSAFERERTWQDGVRRALASLLAFFDSEPLLARVWLVDSLAAGAWALEHRERNVNAFRQMVVSSWPTSDARRAPPLAAEGVMAAVLGIMQAHVLSRKREPLIELLGPLMGQVTAPFLPPSVVAHEVQRGQALAREVLAGRVSFAPPGRGQERAPRIPSMLRNPRAHRVRACLLFVMDHPESNNRQIGAALGIGHDGQVSTLLRRLAECGLLGKRPQGPGRPTTWHLTPEGRRVGVALSELRINSRRSRFTPADTACGRAVNS
jgi:AcrR family transcriptional regulator